jgi:hypothetical protein
MAKKVNDLDPDGVRIVIPWEELDVGSSFFIPCIDVDKGRRQAAEVAYRLGMSLTARVRIEDNRLGLRIWRTT